MKRLIFISSLVFALLLMFACNEEQAVDKKAETNYPPPHNNQNPNMPYLDLVDSVGYYHNKGVDYLREKWDTTWNMSNVDDFKKVMDYSCSFINNNIGPLECPNSISQLFYNYWNTSDPIDAYYSAYLECLNSNGWDTIYHPYDTYFVDTLTKYLKFFVSTGNNEDDYNIIRNYIDLKFSEWELINWDSISTNTKYTWAGTISKAYLNLSSSTIEYWHDYFQTIQRKKRSVQGFIAAFLVSCAVSDVISYEVAYGKALAKDIADGWYNAENHRTAQDKANRISYYNRIATQAGISSSTFGLL